MFTRFRVCSKQVASLASILGASLCLKKFNCDINNPVNHDSDQVVILLSEVSKQSINDHLATLGHSKLISDPKVVISNNPDSKTLRRLVPAFGERVSFRLQGLMTVDDTNTAILYGNSSHFTVKVRDPDYQPAILLQSSDKTHLDNHSDKLKLPLKASSLIHVNLNDLTHETELELVVNDESKEKASVTVSPFMKHLQQQIVVEGHLCSTRYIDENGRCNFDKDSISDTPDYSDEEYFNNISSPMPHAEDESEKCSLCRFMKRGSCRNEFIAWSKCLEMLQKDDDLSKCSGDTLQLMRCMVKDEYYDIMTVNSHHMLPALEKSVEKKTD